MFATISFKLLHSFKIEILNSDSAFTIYNAAAGAGKTYTLVKAYLKALLSYDYKEGYKNILAITFTNKAVAEMKERILQNLYNLSGLGDTEKTKDLVLDLTEETGLTNEKLQQKAEKVLKSILHNYASFDVVTIDTFTHRVIRTFAYDLGIPMNFEIEMDTQLLIQEAVDALISKIGQDKALTETIIDFTLNKLEDDKSWDISKELYSIGGLIYSENDRDHITKLSGKTIGDFNTLKKNLQQKIRSKTAYIIDNSKSILESISSSGLENSDFYRSFVPNHFEKLVTGDLENVDYKAGWKQNISEAQFYTTKLDNEKKQSIDQLRPLIENSFEETKKLTFEILLLKNFLKNITPLSVLTLIQNELEILKKEKKVLLISEFNSIISNAIQDQPAPFIYERLGERYRDYFIDEFQDTSELQWNNLVPLIDNALSTETLSGKRGSITIVGDAKQAIYRWRGGKAEQFINLSHKTNPFSVNEKKVNNLPKNYRSYSEIVDFNNQFFQHLSKEFIDKDYNELYLQGNNQQFNLKEGGFVKISFIEALNKEEENELYPIKVLDAIQELKEKGYPLKEICILVRKQKEGTEIASFLTQHNIPIISSETLLIKNAEEVKMLISFLNWFINKEDILSKVEFIRHLNKDATHQGDHNSIENLLHSDPKKFSLQLKELNIVFDIDKFSLLPLYEALLYFLRSFHITLNIYVKFFLDLAFSYSQKHADGLIGFMRYWESKKDKLSIIAPASEDAVNIMTIHKAKGLEFPCVIYPYANTNIYQEIEPMTWLYVNPEEHSGFTELYTNYNLKLAEINQQGEDIVHRRQSQLQLDNYNLLYVALTRAIKELYIISKLEITSKGEVKENYFSSSFISFLKLKGIWQQDTLEYSFGSSIVQQDKKENGTKSLVLKDNSELTTDKNPILSTTSSQLWGTKAEAAINTGNIIHQLLSEINTAGDLQHILYKYVQKGIITNQEQKDYQLKIESIIHHPLLKECFSEKNNNYNEIDIISKGKVYRPDKIVINNEKNITVIDYKTGKPHTSHEIQIKTYASLFEEMGYSDIKTILVYVSDDILVKSI